MQIAKLFAGLGFQVDTSGLVKFKKAIADARSEMTNTSRGAKTATRQFRSLRRETDKLSASMGKIKNAGGNRQVGGSYRQLAADVWKVKNALDGISTNQSRTTKAIGKINASVIAGLTHWNAYRRSIVQTRRTLQNLNGDLGRLRANSRIDVRIRNTGGNGGGGSGGRGGAGGLGGLGGVGAGLGLRQMMGSFLPALAVSSIGGGIGFAAARGVEAARDQTRMESMILMTSKSGEEFARTLNYVKDEAARLGLSSTELGKSFAQINMSAKGLDQGTKEKMFTGFSEFMMSMGTSQDDQKGIFRAFNQMFSNNRILQEEINQLSERGIPATLVYDAAMKAYDTTNIQKIKKLQEDGKLDPKKVLPIMAKMVQDLAHDSGSYAKMMESSIVKQGQMYEQLRQLSKEIMDSGVDVFLGKIYGQLTDIIKIFKDFALVIGRTYDAYKRFFRYISDTMTTGQKWQMYLYGVVLAIIKMRKQIAIVIPYLMRGGSVMSGLAVLMRGLFGRALGLMILRFGAWAVAIYAVVTAIQFLSDQMRKADLGEWTFFDEIFFATEKAGANMDLMVARFRNAMIKMKILALNPIDVLFGDPSEDIVSRVGGMMGTPKKPYKNVMGLGGVLDNGSIMKNVNRANQSTPIPYRSNTTSRSSTSITLPIVINNKDGSVTRQEQYFNIMHA